MSFFSRLKKEVWKVIRGILILGVIVTLVISIVTYTKKINRPDEIAMIIDSDSGNEIDDLFAISLALIDPKIEIIALNSAQWNMHPLAGDSSVFKSQRINEELLNLHDKAELPHPLGGADQCGYWGDTKPIPSPAADLIIQKVQKLKYGEKLNVVTLGAVTNLASAIQLDTSIIPRIRWYGMGLQYNDRDRIWNKNEFNVRNDLDGMDYLLNLEDLETHIMTATTSKEYTFDRTEIFDLFRNRGPKWDYLLKRWQSVAPESRSWIMWDLALIQAVMNPDLVTEKEVWGPPENLRKRIYVYIWIDDTKMRREFRKLVRKNMADIPSDSE